MKFEKDGCLDRVGESEKGESLFVSFNWQRKLIFLCVAMLFVLQIIMKISVLSLEKDRIHLAKNSDIQTDWLGEPDQKSMLQQWLRFMQTNKDWAEIKTYYEKYLEHRIQTNDPDLNHSLKAAMNYAEKMQILPQQMTFVFEQGIDVFHYYEIMSLIYSIPDLLKAGQISLAEGLLDTSFQIFQHTLAHTIELLDKRYHLNMLEHLDTVLYPSIQQSVKKLNPDQFFLYAEMFNISIIKSYVVQMVHHLNEVESFKTNEKSIRLTEKSYTVDQHRLAARMAYIPIEHNLKPKFFSQVQKINTGLENDTIHIDVTSIKKELTSLFTMEIQALFDQVLVGITKHEKERALYDATKALSYIHALQLLVTELIDADHFSSMVYHADSYYNLVHQILNDKNFSFTVGKISNHAFHVMQILSQIKGVYMKIGDPQLWVDGKGKKFDYIVSFFDTDTDQIWVSLRPMSEALGMQITFHSVEKQIQLDTGEQQIFMQEDHYQVQVVNKEKGRSTITLDHPLRFVHGHAYLSVNDIAKLLQSKVLWFKDELLILPTEKS